MFLRCAGLTARERLRYLENNRQPPMENPERWILHSVMSDTGRHGAAVAELPDGIGALNRVVQGVLIHSDWLGAYGVDESQFHLASRETLPVAERLALVLARDARALSERRPPARRSVGTCRDFALMLCAFLRNQGIPARVRCGFAFYLVDDGWEDHWVCEYWDRRTQCWRLSDAQMDEVLSGRRKIAFDPSDTPRHLFMTAGQAWTACRSGECDPDRFGHGATKGLWFVKVNVVRDHYAINNRETSDWDAWRAAPQSKRVISGSDWASLDDLAGRPEQPAADLNPDWLT
jgi:Transglutaminase-like superfamily